MARFLDPNDKSYYHKLFLLELEEIKKLSKKPSLLLHCCCGPCATYPISLLANYFKLTVFFSNPNIYPIVEYEKRFKALEKFVYNYSKDNDLKIDIIKNDDDFKTYQVKFASMGNEKEGGNRCSLCHDYRLRLGYEYAAKNKYDYFTTVMSVSTKKPSKLLNELGIELNKEFPNTKYLVSDFKKDDGTLKGIELCRQYELYRQDYCGCYFSLKLREYINSLKNNQDDSKANEIISDL